MPHQIVSESAVLNWRMGCRILAVFCISQCPNRRSRDVDRNHLQAALQTAGLDPSDGTGDFRRALARNDIDAVVIATPDPGMCRLLWRRAGKDVYYESR